MTHEDVQPRWVGTGLHWYFDYPEKKPWLPKTRNVSLDPPLIDIVEVNKNMKLDHERRVRPFNWERAFTVKCVLGGTDGGRVEVVMNMRSFVQNTDWDKHPKMEWVRQWLPANLAHVGPIFNPSNRVLQAPPRRPDINDLGEGRPRVDRNADTSALPAPIPPHRAGGLSLAATIDEFNDPALRAAAFEASSVQIEELPDDEDCEGEFDMAAVRARRVQTENAAPRLF